MATGDAAIAAGMANVNGATTPANTIDTELMLTRDYIAPVFGATAAATANRAVLRDAFGRAKFATPSAPGDACTKGYADGLVAGLGSAANQDVSAFVADLAGGNALGLTWAGGRMSMRVDGINVGDIANVGDLGGFVSKTGDTITGHLFLPNAVAATAGYTIAYINGDGRVSKGASGAQFKHDITPVDPVSLGDLFPQFTSFVMNEDPGETTRYGYIAQTLDASADLRPFVIYQQSTSIDEDGNVTGTVLARDEDGHPVPESIDFIGLLLAQVAQLNARVAALEAR